MWFTSFNESRCVGASSPGLLNSINNRVLKREWPSWAAVSIMASLGEVTLRGKDIDPVIKNLEKLVERRLDPSDYAGLCRNVLVITEASQPTLATGKWVHIFRKILKSAHASALPNILYVVESLLLHSSKLHDIIYSDFHAVADHDADFAQKFHFTDLCLCLLVITSKPHLDPDVSDMFKLLSRILLSIAERDIRRTALESTPVEEMWKSVIAVPGMDERSGPILYIAIAFIGLHKPAAALVGEYVFLRAFSELPSCRGVALDELFAALSENSSARVKSRYCRILERLVQLQRIRLQEFHNKIQAWIGHVSLIPDPIASRIVSSLSFLCSSSSFLDFFVMTIRKFLSSRSQIERSLAVKGFCHTLRNCPTLPQETQIEIVACLESALGFPLELRSILFSALQQVITSTVRMQE